MDIKEARHKLGISNSDIAKYFGYKNKKAYENSSAKKRIENGIIKIIEKCSLTTINNNP